MTGSNEGEKVCVIGLGLMGSALAEALLASGHRVTVWNRTASKCEALAKAGAAVAATVSEAVAAAQAIFLCVTDHEAGDSLLRTDGVADALRGKLLVQLSTMTADQSRATALWAEARGAVYLEGSILGLPLDVTGGSAIVVYAGPQDAYDDNIEVFRALGGDPQFISEEIGAAVTFDKVYYAFAYGMMHAFMQGAALAHANGFSIEAYSGTVAARLPTSVWKLKQFGEMIAARNHDDVQCRLDVHAAAFADTLAMCRKLGVDDALPAAMMRNFERADAAGHAHQEITALFEVLIPDGKAAPEG
jgi:3-hydroxyisobutyrate dehydrogenase-like beta-hydroxyacid dehydrogenase